MAHTSKIEWTEATWNPWYGCHKVSPGCKNCYMYDWARRAGRDPNIVVRSKTTFRDPLKWPEPRLIFTCSLSDFFIEEADEWRSEAWEIIRSTSHIYQIVTKRPDLIGPRLPDDWDEGYENVWLITSVENSDYLWRIDELLKHPAKVHGLSMEPLLGPVDIRPYLQMVFGQWNGGAISCKKAINWVIAGGESGNNARPMHPNWPRDLRDQCLEFNVPFFFKQWGEWLPFEATAQQPFYRNCATGVEYDAHGMNFIGNDGFGPGKFLDAKWMDPHDAIAYNEDEWDVSYLHVGKMKAGRLLDGREWNKMPEVMKQ